MAIKAVITYPNDRLKIEAGDVSEFNETVKQVITDLRDTMFSTTHSVGIAATQIGSDMRIISVDASRNKKCDNYHGELIMINPEILSHEGLISYREGCMSVPDYTGNVNRAERIMVSFLDEHFNKQVLEAKGFEAVVIQHECDHLDGILFIDRVISKRTDLFKRKNY